MKERLKAFVDETGQLYAGDKVWSFFSSISWDFEPAKLKELAMSIAVEGKDLWSYLSLPAATLKKLGWNDSSLSRFGTTKTSKRFDSRKA